MAQAQRAPAEQPCLERTSHTFGCWPGAPAASPVAEPWPAQPPPPSGGPSPGAGKPGRREAVGLVKCDGAATRKPGRAGAVQHSPSSVRNACPAAVQQCTVRAWCVSVARVYASLARASSLCTAVSLALPPAGARQHGCVGGGARGRPGCAGKSASWMPVLDGRACMPHGRSPPAGRAAHLPPARAQTGGAARRPPPAGPWHRTAPAAAVGPAVRGAGRVENVALAVDSRMQEGTNRAEPRSLQSKALPGGRVPNLLPVVFRKEGQCGGLARHCRPEALLPARRHRAGAGAAAGCCCRRAGALQLAPHGVHHPEDQVCLWGGQERKEGREDEERGRCPGPRTLVPACDHPHIPLDPLTAVPRFDCLVQRALVLACTTEIGHQERSTSASKPARGRGRERLQGRSAA